MDGANLPGRTASVNRTATRAAGRLPRRTRIFRSMYTTRLFCFHSLGRNESVEACPVGRRLAFDATQGRLWVVCTSCARWNLTPIEERWEAVEQCERLFRDHRLRRQTEHVGLVRAGDGLELVRIGTPLPPEFAAWRYGQEFTRRFRRRTVGAGRPWRHRRGGGNDDRGIRPSRGHRGGSGRAAPAACARSAHGCRTRDSQTPLPQRLALEWPYTNARRSTPSTTSRPRSSRPGAKPRRSPPPGEMVLAMPHWRRTGAARSHPSIFQDPQWSDVHACD